MPLPALLMLIFLALIGGCGLGAPAYPTFNANAYRIEGYANPEGAGAATRTVVYRDGADFRIESTLLRYGRATVVFDHVGGGAYILNPTIQQSEIAPTADAPIATAVDPSGGGVALRIADGDAPQPLETQWATLSASSAHSVADCRVAGYSGHQWRHASTSDLQRSACITSDGIVLSLRENDRVLFEATSLQRQRQNPALFGVPPGYRTINPYAIATEPDGKQSQ